MARRPLRPDAAHELEDMTDRELLEIVFFGNLHTDPETQTFRATPAQQREAAAILKARGAGIPANLQRPDPRRVLSGRQEDIDAVRAADERWHADRVALLKEADS
jgi:hypothetical protein